MPHNQSLLLGAPILFIDSDEAHTYTVCRMLEWAGYANITVSAKPREALALYQRLEPDLVLLDLHMPGVNETSLLRQISELSTGSFLPVLVFTGPVSREVKAAALAAGASDFLTKPGESSEVLARVGTFLQMRNLRRQLGAEHLTIEECIKVRTAELDHTCREMAERFARTVEFRSEANGVHAQRVGDLSARIAGAMGLSSADVNFIRLAAPLHDLGNVAVSDEILLKPGALSESEREAMKTHTLVGSDLLTRGRSGVIQMAEKIARTHHEWWDGTGYPLGLKGAEIPLSGRIVAVADVFDALTHDRPYKRSWVVDEAVFEIERFAGVQFDPATVRAFKQVLVESVDPFRAA